MCHVHSIPYEHEYITNAERRAQVRITKDKDESEMKDMEARIAFLWALSQAVSKSVQPEDQKKMQSRTFTR